MEKNFFASNLRLLRTRRGLEQKDISDFLGLKSATSVTNWEKGTNLARAGHLSDLASFFNVSLHDLVKVDLSLDKQSNDILDIYNTLHHPRQQKVYNFAKEQLDEQQAESNVIKFPDKIEEEKALYEIRDYGPISAGTGEWTADERFEIVNLEHVPTGTDFCLTVNGDSMEPLFHDGEYVFIKKDTDLRSGTIGAIIVNGEAFLKKIYTEENRLRLVSLNPKYEDVIVDENDTYKYVGTVVL